MDFMCEQVVRCNLGTKKIIYKLLILFLALAIPVVVVAIGMITQVYYCFIVAVFVALFSIYGVWFFWSELNIEFEYTVFSGELSISKVVANRKRKDVLKLDLRMVENIEKYQNQAKGGHLVYAGIYAPQDVLRFFTLYYQGKEEYISDKERLNWEFLKAVLPVSSEKFTLYFYTNQEKMTALFSNSDLSKDIIHDALPLGTYSIPLKDRLEKMELFYQEILGKYADKNFKCTDVFPNVVQLLDQLAGPQTRCVVPEGYI